ncbi:tyrosine kinase receptor Cad96Ca [Contarinia nasturtii]|uniref:tyrosine kinase receptor Cad96Ca n=1 Tax=Contarinia nasturtii TaxID=265458 RepID=UPI0012D4085A|nr:tyrosine kinase receptor Cad96Ca [Contarinia nasturtii]XP_031634139.1 tyrosine kinase receptor Cad96Ca [Contarinia nasturtii]XP_031634140.1 tyrosine kinase receptor Cad96Ca [Contarinia nasturtii]XP_031634141.1 tyrosine kinase receptor Cad96Ca [Contarinia nasturtii]XP_031634142.1 tyrosine kinase receptor Cad96Ca [Contarinia nasturtii]
MFHFTSKSMHFHLTTSWMHTIVILIVVFILNTVASKELRTDQVPNSPPVVLVDNHWKIPEDEKIDTVIARVQASDNDPNDVLTFGLEPSDGAEDEQLPFRINRDTGVVYLNESLEGRGGQNFLLYVTVTDGTYHAKNGVFVNIKSKNSQATHGNGAPSFIPHPHNVTRLLPPFNTLPGVPTPPPPYPIYTLPPNYVHTPKTNSSMPTKTPPTTSTTTATNEIPSSTDENPNGNATHSDADGNTMNGTNSTSETTIFPRSTLKTVLPIAIIVCGIIIASGLIVSSFVFRKRLCAIGKSLKNKSKEEMAKKSNQSNSSFNTNTVMMSSISEDSRNSMVMQHWNGPTAFSNRYVPWERENSHMQATSQLSTSSSNSQGKSDRWDFPRHRLKFFNILGEGAFGQVWRCEAIDMNGKEGVTTVAVKTLKENATDIERNDLHSELQVMKTLDPHINVVRLLGCCVEKEPIFVIMEYVNCGKLQTYLRNSRAERHYGNTHGKSNILTSGDLTSFMYQVARGMDYLSSRGIIHRDLAARNVLITDDHTCKIADFGFARDVITSKIYERKSEGKLPIRWMAIESLYDNIFSVKSDIWSFGILMWEIVTLGSTPYPGTAAADVMRKVRDGYRLEKPEHCRREIYNVMYYCWSKDPQDRPSFSEIVKLLDKLLVTEMDYIQLEHFPDHNYYNMLSVSGEKL